MKTTCEQLKICSNVVLWDQNMSWISSFFFLNQNLYQNVWSYLSLLLFGESAMSCLIHTLCLISGTNIILYLIYILYHRIKWFKIKNHINLLHYVTHLQLLYVIQALLNKFWVMSESVLLCTSEVVRKKISDWWLWWSGNFD